MNFSLTCERDHDIQGSDLHQGRVDPYSTVSDIEARERRGLKGPRNGKRHLRPVREKRDDDIIGVGRPRQNEGHVITNLDRQMIAVLSLKVASPSFIFQTSQTSTSLSLGSLFAGTL